MLLALALLLAHGEIVWPPHAPRLTVLDRGSVFNFDRGEMARVNASAHAASSALLVTLGERFGGRKGMWLTTGTYAGLKVIHEACFHNAEGPEVRTDIASTIGVAFATAAAFEAFHTLGWLQWSK
ncbi:MAG: hypothetical protein ACJ78Y_16720 [Myxococcales bacterium]